MNRPRILRLLRITVSVMCGILCLSLIALWVRSCSWSDEVTLASRLQLSSAYGCIQYKALFAPYSFKKDWDYSCWSIADEGSILEVAKNGLFRFRWSSTNWPGSVPYWVAVFAAATLTVVPWIRQLRWRFSLRTLLLATTLIAVMLGLIVMLANRAPTSPPIDHVDAPEFSTLDTP